MSCYTSWNSLTTMAMFGSFVSALMADFSDPDCLDKMGVILGLLVGGLAVNAMIGVMMCMFTAYLIHSRAYTYYSRMYLGRCAVLTTTTKNRVVFILAYIMDSITVFMLILETALLPSIREHCPTSVITFY